MLGLSFLLLMVVFRSLLVPLKAVIMNLLSIGAAYGVVVAVFQWGWGGGLLDIEGAPIEPFVPMMLFAIVFGLSMDYEVFLLSRVREEWDRTGDSRTSVADGLASTARVITAAAAIMVVVFGSFIGESDRVVKLFGLGLLGGRADRRHHRPHAARAGDDGAARRPQLVDPPLARPHPAPRETLGSAVAGRETQAMVLSAEEARVVACLVEKETTVPDSYPLTLSALRLACNQTTNRDPVVAYDDRTVEAVLLSLKSMGLVRFVHPSHGGRTIRYRHVAGERWHLSPAEARRAGRARACAARRP